MGLISLKMRMGPFITAKRTVRQEKKDCRNPGWISVPVALGESSRCLSDGADYQGADQKEVGEPPCPIPRVVPS
jgi:hypothetical protein